MKFIYKPEGAEPREWVYRPRKMLNVESEAIEEITGWTYAEFGEKFMAGSMKAYHALLWVFLRRGTPGLKYDAVQFSMDEVDTDYDDDEIRDMVTQLEEHEDELGDAELAALTELREELKKRGVGETAGKVSEETGDANSSGSSPTTSTLIPSPSTN